MELNKINPCIDRSEILARNSIKDPNMHKLTNIKAKTKGSKTGWAGFAHPPRSTGALQPASQFNKTS